MARVIIDMTIPLDGYVAGPDDGPAFPWANTADGASSTGTTRAWMSTVRRSSSRPPAQTSTR